MNDFFCIALPIILLIALIVGMVMRSSARRKALEEASAAYQEALAALRKRPTDTTAYQRALNSGRAYSSLARENKGTTIFDEVALQNDLQAATAGGRAAAAVSTPAPVAPASSVENRLQQLEALRTKGLVTEAEYQERRAKILSDM